MLLTFLLHIISDTRVWRNKSVRFLTISVPPIPEKYLIKCVSNIDIIKKFVADILYHIFLELSREKIHPFDKGGFLKI